MDFALCGARIVMLIVIFHAQWTDGRDLRDVLAGLRPVKMPRVTGQNDNGAGRVGDNLVAVERFTEADIKDAGHDGVNPVFRMTMRHQLRVAGGLDAGHIGTRLRGIADKNGEADRRREGRERLPVYVFLEDRAEIGFAGLVGSNHAESLPVQSGAYPPEKE